MRRSPERPVRGRACTARRTVRRLAIAVSCALVVGPGLAHAADDPTAALHHAREGVEAYTHAMASTARDERLALFAEAERRFGAAIEAGARNADIETNRGNAALQTQRLGPAVLAYRRALLLDPGHERARQNLAHVRGLLPEWVPRPAPQGLADTFFFWQRRVSATRIRIGAAVAFAIGCALVAGAILRPSALARTGAGVAFLAWGALLVSLVFGPAREQQDAGVVVLAEVTARAADSVNAPTRFSEPLPGGTELRILEDRGGWQRIELHNGRTAWVPSSAIARVPGPVAGGPGAPGPDRASTPR
jgi:hypothetical protein